jgi:endoglucanase
MHTKKRMSILSAVMILSAVAASFAATTFSGEDYREAGWLTLRFLGAQRCGSTGNWALKGHDSSKGGEVCHTKDGDTVGHDLTGGWHDCGDHWKVCFTMGFAAYTLLKAYEIFPAGFQDIYKQTYSYTDSMPEADGDGIPDVINEAKVATDYFIKAIPDSNTFYAECGNPDYDHQEWKTSAYQSLNSVVKGGNPRPVVALTDKAGASCAQFTAALAVMAKLWPSFGAQSYADSCKKAAIMGYAYAKKNYSNQYYNSGFYQENSEGTDDMIVAASELYFLTGDTTYKNQAKNFIVNKWESGWAYSWNSLWEAAYYDLLKIDSSMTNQSGKTVMTLFKGSYTTAVGKKNSAGLCFFDGWGSCRYAGGVAFAMMMLYDITKKSYPAFADSALALAQSQVDYCLGNNEFERSFIHGFGSNSWNKVHHRNIQGIDDNPTDAIKEATEFKFKRSGALIGGPTAPNTFNNSIVDYTCTESGCDYNAGITGALAGLISIKEPYSTAIKSPYNKSSASSGRRDSQPMLFVKPFSSDNRSVKINYVLDKTAPVSLSVLNAKAQVIAVIKNGMTEAGSHDLVFNASGISSGLYFIDLTSGNYSVVRRIAIAK